MLFFGGIINCCVLPSLVLHDKREVIEKNPVDPIYVKFMRVLQGISNSRTKFEAIPPTFA